MFMCFDLCFSVFSLAVFYLLFICVLSVFICFYLCFSVFSLAVFYLLFICFFVCVYMVLSVSICV